MKALTDEQIIRKHDPGCRGRAYIELQIVNKLIVTAAAAGYTLKVWDGYEEDGDGAGLVLVDVLARMSAGR